MNWLLAHFDTLRESLVRLARQPFATGLNVIVIGIALSLPVGFISVSTICRRFRASFPATRRSASSWPWMPARPMCRQWSGVCGPIPKSAASIYRARTGAGQTQAQRGIGGRAGRPERNPLPDAFVVTARNNDPATLEALRDQATHWPKVEHVQLDAEWARRLDAALGVGRLLVTLLAALLALALVAVTFNTIRLQILTRRDEIEVSKLIGATNPFIRRPFLYLGALQGLAGGCAAWAIVNLAVLVLNVQLAELATLYGTAFKLEPLDAADSAILLVFSAALGWLGAWLSVSRHLWQIEPR
jgi:cell division transport system permease protein